MPQVSIILPTYNRARFLPFRIKEFVQQTHKDSELVIVNDASTDETELILAEASKMDARIKTITLSKNSKTVSIPRNIGIVNSTGKYIIHWDDDDIHPKHSIEVLYNALVSKPQDYILAYGDHLSIFAAKFSITRIPSWNPTAIQGWGVGNGEFIYKRCFDKVPLVFCTRACDWELCKLLYTIGKFHHEEEVIKYTIWHGNNRSLFPETKFVKFNVDDYAEYFPKNYKLIEV